MNMYSVLMEFDGCTHKDCRWDGWVCRCVHMSVIVQEGTSHIGVLRCPVNAFPNPPTSLPPLHPLPYIPMLQGYKGWWMQCSDLS